MQLLRQFYAQKFDQYPWFNIIDSDADDFCRFNNFLCFFSVWMWYDYHFLLLIMDFNTIFLAGDICTLCVMIRRIIENSICFCIGHCALLIVKSLLWIFKASRIFYQILLSFLYSISAGTFQET